MGEGKGGGWREKGGEGKEQWEGDALREEERSGIGPIMTRKNGRPWTFNFMQTIRVR